MHGPELFALPYCKANRKIYLYEHQLLIDPLVAIRYTYYRLQSTIAWPRRFDINNYLLYGVTMQEYVCPLCGYIYDPVVGDPDEGIPPNTPFEDLPDEWLCPICGASKDVFFAKG